MRRINNLVNKTKTWISPEVPTSQESLKDLRAKTLKLEQQADYAEAEAILRTKAEKAKTRIKAVRKSRIQPIHIMVGIVFIAIIIIFIVKGC